MSYVKVLARGRLMIPRKLREQARIEPGDYIEIVEARPGCLEIRAISPYRLSELIERDRRDSAGDVEEALRRAEQAEADELLGQPGVTGADPLPS